MEFVNKLMKELSEDFKEKDFFDMLKLHTQIGVECAIAYLKYLKLIIRYMKETETLENKQILG
jgi:hypothetical protein